MLDQINYPSDLRKFSVKDLPQIANELRQATIEAVAETGGHLGAGLGVVELTTALHYVFDTPNDKIIWDVGHQAYPHKILTGRKDRIKTIRQPNGLSGFTKRGESEFDVFGAGHSSTSISAGFGIAVAKKINNEKSHVIAVIGDGAISAGMAYEAMNNAGAGKGERLLVILNDNDMSIAPPVGAMSNYLSRLAASKSYLKFRDLSKRVINKLPKAIAKFPRKFEKATKEWWMGGNIFEEMGFYYIGPIDGHNLDVLVPILQNIYSDKATTPVLLHIVTQKGRGYNDKMQSNDKLHAVTKFNVETGIAQKKNSQYLGYSKIFGTALTNLAKNDKKILAITAAMPEGTGLNVFSEVFPERFFDVAIAEQHAVTFAAGLATENFKPFVAIYSTFLQRAYDQIVHDVAIQKLPVKFAIDRAGFVGADGPTHAGSFDIAFLMNLPNFVLMAAANGQELVKMVNTANQINDRPCAFRFPRGETELEIDFKDAEVLEVGKGRIVQKGQKVAIISFGAILSNVLAASKILEEKSKLTATIVDARFAKPFDEDLIRNLAMSHNIIISIEEGVIGGFGSALAQFLLNEGLMERSGFKFRSMFMKDEFIQQNSVDKMQEESGIGVFSIVNLVKSII